MVGERVEGFEGRRPDISGRPTAAKLLPGLVGCAALAATAWGIERVTGVTGSAPLVAVLCGLATGNVRRGIPFGLAPGSTFAARRFLEAAVVLMGTQISVQQVGALGWRTFALLLPAMIAMGLGVLVAVRRVSADAEIPLLTAVGMAVCGNTAIAALAPVVRARTHAVSIAVATVTGYGTIAMLLYPVLARALGLPDQSAGLWLGLAINDTSQVIGASAVVSEVARDTATLVKLIRNTMIAPIIVACALHRAWREGAGTSAATRLWMLRSPQLVKASMPPFVVAFAVMMAINSAGFVPEDLIGAAAIGSRGLILVALAALGLQTQLSQIRSAGWRPFLAGALTAGAVALVLLTLIAKGAA